MSVELTKEEARIMGSLMEKAVITPDLYPLTLNALTNACNQKSSRDPVMDLSPGFVQRTARGLEAKHLVTIREGSRSTEKYTQRLCNTPLAQYQFSDGEYAVMTLLLLRGPQTPGELRSRSGRLHTFGDNQAVVDVLQGLIDREKGAVVARLPRKPGRQDHEYMHLLSGEIESVAEDMGISQRPPAASRETRIEALEQRVASLEQALKELAERVDRA